MKKLLKVFFTVRKPIGREECLELWLEFLATFFASTLVLLVVIPILGLMLFILIFFPGPVAFKIRDDIVFVQFVVLGVFLLMTICILFKRLWHIFGSKKKALIACLAGGLIALIPRVGLYVPHVFIAMALLVPGKKLDTIKDYYPDEQDENFTGQ